MAVNGSNKTKQAKCPCCDSAAVYRKAGTNSRHALTIADRRKHESADAQVRDAA